MNVGVPIIEAPPTPGPRPLTGKAIVAEGVDVGSLLITCPEALLYILLGTESVETLRIRGTGESILSHVASVSRTYDTPIYAFAFVDSGELRILAYGGFITGVYYEHGGSHLVGVKAVEGIWGGYL